MTLPTRRQRALLRDAAFARYALLAAADDATPNVMASAPHTAARAHDARAHDDVAPITPRVLRSLF